LEKIPTHKEMIFCITISSLKHFHKICWKGGQYVGDESKFQSLENPQRHRIHPPAEEAAME